MGEASLTALVVAPEQIASARALALAHDGVRVVVRSADDAAPPRWVLSLLSASPDAFGVVGTLLSQAASLGALGSPDALGDIEHRGVVLRTGNGTPRWIGGAARRRARETRLRMARQAVAEAERSLAKSEAARAHVHRARKAAERVERAFSALGDVEIVRTHAAVQSAWQALGDADERHAESTTRLEAAEGRCRDGEAVVLALRARVQREGILELARRLQSLRDAESAAARREADARKQEAETSVRESALALQLQAFVQEEQRIAELLVERCAHLRAALALLSLDEAKLDDAALERWVRVTMRGDKFSRSENIEERQREADRREPALCTEIEGDGSRGLRKPRVGGALRVRLVSPTLKVCDRRGDPLEGVLAKLDRDLAEQREVAGERTRDLMDRLVMGDLARELQAQVERLYRTVREINALLGEVRFGTTRYQFKVSPQASARELVELVRKQSALDESSRVKFRAFIDERLEELRRTEPDSDTGEAGHTGAQRPCGGTANTIDCSRMSHSLRAGSGIRAAPPEAAWPTPGPAACLE